MAWGKKSPQEKADSFDAQHKASTNRANAKRNKGEYPYDLDRKAEGNERRKGKK